MFVCWLSQTPTPITRELCRGDGAGSEQSRDWTEVTRAEDIDVVSIAVPNFLHAEIAIDALRQGKHVICEKPLANDLAGARAMCIAANESESLAQVCFYYRLWPAVAWAHQLVHEGILGTLQHFRGWMFHDYAADAKRAMGWRTTRVAAGAGALGDIGSHIIDIARCLCGDIRAVNATSRQFVQRQTYTSDVDDAVAMLVDFESGASGVLEAGWAMRGHKYDLGFDLIGDRGAVRFSWERSNEIEVLDGEPDGELDGFKRVLVGGEMPDARLFVGVPGQGIGYRDAFTIGIGHAVVGIATKAKQVAPSFRRRDARCRGGGSGSTFDSNT